MRPESEKSDLLPRVSPSLGVGRSGHLLRKIVDGPEWNKNRSCNRGRNYSSNRLTDFGTVLRSTFRHKGRIPSVCPPFPCNGFWIKKSNTSYVVSPKNALWSAGKS